LSQFSPGNTVPSGHDDMAASVETQRSGIHEPRTSAHMLWDVLVLSVAASVGLAGAAFVAAGPLVARNLRDWEQAFTSRGRGSVRRRDIECDGMIRDVQHLAACNRRDRKAHEPSVCQTCGGRVSVTKYVGKSVVSCF
jgi:hypothetical protein